LRNRVTNQFVVSWITSRPVGLDLVENSQYRPR